MDSTLNLQNIDHLGLSRNKRVDIAQGARLRKLRTDNNLSPEEFAQRVDNASHGKITITLESIDSFEEGTCSMSPIMVRLFARALKVKEREILINDISDNIKFDTHTVDPKEIPNIILMERLILLSHGNEELQKSLDVALNPVVSEVISQRSAEFVQLCVDAGVISQDELTEMMRGATHQQIAATIFGIEAKE